MPAQQPRPRPDPDSDSSGSGSSILFKLLWGLSALGLFLGGVGMLLLAIVAYQHAPELVAELPRMTDAIYELARSMEGIQIE